jgi:uncharacterized protein (TIGR02246 family)
MSDPEAVHRLFEQYVNKAAIDEALALYDADAVMVERDGKLVIGLNAIREHLAGLLAIRPRITIRHRTTIRAGKIAVLISDWELEAVGPNDEAIRDGGRTYDIVRQQEDGNWLLAVDNPWHVTPE